MSGIPLHDGSLELSCLNSVLIKENVLPDVMNLTDDDFYMEKHRQIFCAMRALYDEGHKIDFLTLEQKLKENGHHDPKILTSLLKSHIPINATDVIDRLSEFSKKRLLQNLGLDLQQKAAERKVKTEEILDFVDMSVRMLGDTRNTDLQKINSVGKTIEEFDLSGKYLTTGINDLDHILTGMFETQLIILGARPGAGKTALAMQIASNVSKDRDVLFVSMEMLTKQLKLRMISSESEIEVNKLKTGRLTDHEKDLAYDAIVRIDEKYSNMLFLQKQNNIDVIINRIKSQNQKRKLGLVIIDYLQLLSGGKGERQDIRIASLTWKIKQLAISLEIPIVLLSQLSRKVESREGAPQLSDLRESGALEQDADVVIFLYQEDKLSNDMQAIVAKNRDGPIGATHLKFIKRYFQFRSIAPQNFEDAMPLPEEGGF